MPGRARALRDARARYAEPIHASRFDPRITPAGAEISRRGISRARSRRRALSKACVHEVVEPHRAAAPRRRRTMRRSIPRRCSASASPSTRPTTRAGPGASSTPTAMSAGCRRTRCAPPGPAPTHKVVGAAHAGVSRARRSSCRRSTALPIGRAARGGAAAGVASRSRPPAAIVPARISRRSTRARPDFVAVAERFLGTPYLWGGKTSARPRLLGPGAGGADTPAASPARATATCRRGARRVRSALARICGAAIWCSGRATSPSRATATRCCTPMPFTWRWRSSRPPRRSRASAAAGSAGHQRQADLATEQFA